MRIFQAEFRKRLACRERKCIFNHLIDVLKKRANNRFRFPRRMGSHGLTLQIMLLLWLKQVMNAIIELETIPKAFKSLQYTKIKRETR